MYCVAWNEEDVGDARLLKHGYLICTDVFCWFQPWNHWKRLKNVGKKCFDQLLGAGSTQKLVEIHNKWVHESKWQNKQCYLNDMKTGLLLLMVYDDIWILSVIQISSKMAFKMSSKTWTFSSLQTSEIFSEKRTFKYLTSRSPGPRFTIFFL